MENAILATQKTFPCAACNGTGEYRGIRVHQERSDCFKCKGKGFFLTSPAERMERREKARIARENRKAKELIKNTADFREWLEDEDMLDTVETLLSAKDEFITSLYHGGCQYGELTEKQEDALVKAVDRAKGAQTKAQAFRAENAAVVAWLESNTGNFAESLLAGLNKWGSLSEKQVAAVERIVAQDSNRLVLDLTRINEMFATAKANGVSRPILRYLGIAISIAPEHGKNAGCLYVKVDGEYAGKINSEGKFFAYHAPEGTEDKLIEIAKDPMKALTAHGFQTGECSCCGRQLTNALSIELGIGPICRSKWGLA